MLFFGLVLVSCSKNEDPCSLTTPLATPATAVSAGQFKANWNKVSGANAYHLQVAVTDDFSAMAQDIDLLAGPTEVLNLEANQTYYYRVSASVNNGNPTPFSNVVSVTTRPDAPLAKEATAIMAKSFQAHWQKEAGISEYKLFISTSNDFSKPSAYLKNFAGIVVEGDAAMVSGLQPNQVYYYRVKAIGQAGESEFSENTIAVLTEPGQ